MAGQTARPRTEAGGVSASVYLAILIVGMCGAVWHVVSQLRRSACARSREKQR